MKKLLYFILSVLFLVISVGSFGSAGAFSTVSGTVSIIGDILTGEKSLSEGIDAWKANQSGAATAIKRGADEYVSDVIQKVKEGTATPEEIQNVLKITGIEGNYNLVYTESGEVVVIDGENRVVNGFYDLLNEQGYVNVGNGAATDAETLLRADAEERAHYYVRENEGFASDAATNELAYYNFVARWGGGTTTDGSYGGFGTTAQYNWNQLYNTGTSSLLARNTAQASLVDSTSKVYQTSAICMTGPNPACAGGVLFDLGKLGLAALAGAGTGAVISDAISDSNTSQGSGSSTGSTSGADTAGSTGTPMPDPDDWEPEDNGNKDRNTDNNNQNGSQKQIEKPKDILDNLGNKQDITKGSTQNISTSTTKSEVEKMLQENGFNKINKGNNVAVYEKNGVKYTVRGIIFFLLL